MKIKDIVNRNIATLTNCEHEPIHIPGSIQPHGFLLSLNSGWNINYCSANISTFVDVQLKEILGRNFEAIFGEEAHNLLQDFISNGKFLSIFPLELHLLGKAFQLSIHRSNSNYVLEGEPKFLETANLTDVYTQNMQFLAYMNKTTSLKELCGFVVEGIRQITGYDRVMVYRFDEQYNGEVFAENCREDLEPFIGLHYPHTDIPAQARKLYLRNQIRLIVDVDYKPVPIFTTDDGNHKENKDLDLSLSILRSSSPIHIEYLQNMGVGATLTISLIHQGRLWGLIACHHYTAKNISAEIRLAAKLQGQFLTSQIDLRQSNDEYKIARETSLALERLTGLNLPEGMDNFETYVLNKNLLLLCNAAGVSIIIGDKIHKNGLTPSNDQILNLIKEITRYTDRKIFITNKLHDYFPELNCGPDVAGIIYHSLGNGNSILWYKPETISEVKWGGDPEKAIIKDRNGLHPRNSFDLWKQIVKNRSSAWLQPELNSTAKYVHSLYNQIILIMLNEEQKRYRSQSQILKETNAELENINWISTHDLQEPLRKIQILISRILSEFEDIPAVKSREYLLRTSKSANRMQRLLQDILKYNRLNHFQGKLEIININSIMEETLDDLKEIIKDSGAVIEYENLPDTVGNKSLMKQLFQQIIHNSLKYASPERAPTVKINVIKKSEILDNSRNEFTHYISIVDNGIGFDQKYAESIFNIFTRLHSIEEYNGSGMGLALCKKIMKIFGGTISATGELNKGTVITLKFPSSP
ncbi:ATP-binding protein [Arenibacter sp. M-2]|uniref:ATP-binding protein n=1 Tax=Arenibacter sp. M-2 TaxID=3053612 RepID=UPI00257037C3|nr:ATP-binding protein [Arenibacter sp. M-2]MDL5511185.1 ATP-binding protein [Arenibacter sp. M-2]